MHRVRQASGLILFALIIGLGALVWGVLDAGASGVFAGTLNQTTNATAESIIEERQTIWDNMLFFVILIAGLVLLGRAFLQSS
jgi:hypothetical protein